MRHEIDKARLIEGLQSRGWSIDRFGSWTAPTDKTRPQCDEDWLGAIVDAVLCEPDVPATVQPVKEIANA